MRVAVERPASRGDSYVRYAQGISESPVGCGAWSGALFARHKVDRDYFGIEIQEINGDLDSADASSGAAVASAVATWIAYGADWNDADLVDTYGWSLRRPTGG